MIPVVMERGCRNPGGWAGTVGGKLGGKLYVDLSSDDAPAFAKGVTHLVSEIRTILKGGEKSGLGPGKLEGSQDDDEGPDPRMEEIRVRREAEVRAMNRQYNKALGERDQFVKYLARQDFWHLWMLDRATKCKASMTIAAVPKRDGELQRTILMI